MIQKINIIVNANTLEMRESSGNIIGEIFFSIDGKIFPEESWSDFVVVIMTWWLEVVSKIKMKQKPVSFKLDFMDGPLFIKGYLRSEGETELEFTEEKLNKDEIFFTSTCDIAQLKICIVDAAKELLKQIEKRGWDTDDIRRLRYLVNQI